MKFCCFPIIISMPEKLLDSLAYSFRSLSLLNFCCKCAGLRLGGGGGRFLTPSVTSGDGEGVSLISGIGD